MATGIRNIRDKVSSSSSAQDSVQDRAKKFVDQAQKIFEENAPKVREYYSIGSEWAKENTGLLIGVGVGLGVVGLVTFFLSRRGDSDESSLEQM